MTDYAALFRAFLEATSDLVALKDRAGRFAAISRSMYTDLGFGSEAELIGRNEAAVWPDRPDLSAPRIAEDLAVIATGEPLGPVETEIQVKGEPRCAAGQRSRSGAQKAMSSAA